MIVEDADEDMRSVIITQIEREVGIMKYKNKKNIKVLARPKL